jgi:hypothetical protein
MNKVIADTVNDSGGGIRPLCQAQKRARGGRNLRGDMRSVRESDDR